VPRAATTKRTLATALAAVGSVAVTPGIASAVTPLPVLDAARLQGVFVVSGVVTQAVGVPGEHRGEPVTRTWALLPACPVGACATIGLVRTRAAGQDELLLHRRGPGLYSGDGTFVAPVRCAGRLYQQGEGATFTITIQITAAVAQGAAVPATGFSAAYRNRARIGLTRCFSAPSYDSARYVGAPAAAGAIRSVASTRSSTAS